jgi:class 3 adenylate cyclase
MSEFPTGTVTFLFTDIEGSTDLARRLGNRWPDVLGAHHEIVRRAIGDHDGVEVLNEGDAFFAVFGLAADAVAATADAQRALAAHEWPPDGAGRVRMGLHTGEGRLAGGAYVASMCTRPRGSLPSAMETKSSSPRQPERLPPTSCLPA